MEAVEHRDVNAYSNAHAQVLVVEQTRRDQQRRQRRQRTEDALVDAVPELVESVLATLGDQAWDERFNNWEQSWRWAAADSWLQKRTDDAYQHQLWQRRREAEQAIGTRFGGSGSSSCMAAFFRPIVLKTIGRASELARGSESNG